MMRNKTENFTGWILMMMVFGITMVGAPMVVVAAGSTVERHPQGGSTTTVAREGACVIDLTAPKTKGACHLKVTDPPATLVVKKWYTDTGIPDMIKALAAPKLGTLKGKMLDKMAGNMLSSESKSPSGFWDAKVRIAPAKLDAASGGTNEWKRKDAYTIDELKQAKVAAIKWANGWKNYRGSRFGK